LDRESISVSGLNPDGIIYLFDIAKFAAIFSPVWDRANFLSNRRANFKNPGAYMPNGPRKVARFSTLNGKIGQD
jgi:hypothetical protein